MRGTPTSTGADFPDWIGAERDRSGSERAGPLLAAPWAPGAARTYGRRMKRPEDHELSRTGEIRPGRADRQAYPDDRDVIEMGGFYRACGRGE